MQEILQGEEKETAVLRRASGESEKRQLSIAPVAEATRARETITDRRGRGVGSLDSRKSTCPHTVRDWRLLPRR